MRKIMTAIALTAGIILSVCAEEKSNNPFQTTNDKFAKGQWRMANWRKAKIKVSQKDGKLEFKAEPDDPKIDGAMFCSDKIKVQPGQKIRISIKVSGNGTVIPGIWCYDAKGKFIGSRGTKKTLTKDSQMLFAEEQIPRGTAYVWTAFHVSGGSTAVVEQMEFQIADQKSK